MAQDWAKAFYHSPAWRKTRVSYMMRVIDTSWGPCPPGMCERCFERGELVPATVCHHKIHLSPNNLNDARITLGYDNLQRLCQDCHAFVHSGQSESRVSFDENGRVIPKQNDKHHFSCMDTPDRNRYDERERRG